MIEGLGMYPVELAGTLFWGGLGILILLCPDCIRHLENARDSFWNRRLNRNKPLKNQYGDEEMREVRFLGFTFLGLGIAIFALSILRTITINI